MHDGVEVDKVAGALFDWLRENYTGRPKASYQHTWAELLELPEFEKEVSEFRSWVERVLHGLDLAEYDVLPTNTWLYRKRVKVTPKSARFGPAPKMEKTVIPTPKKTRRRA